MKSCDFYKINDEFIFEYDELENPKEFDSKANKRVSDKIKRSAKRLIDKKYSSTKKIRNKCGYKHCFSCSDNRTFSNVKRKQKSDIFEDHYRPF